MKTLIKTECSVRRKLLERIHTVLDTYCYDEINIFGGSKDYAELIINAEKEFLYDEVKPNRLFSFAEDKVYSYIGGVSNAAAYAEMIVVMINSIIASGIKEFTVKMKGEKSVYTAELLKQYGLSDYIFTENEGDGFSFEGVTSAKKKCIFKGEAEGNSVYSVMFMENIISENYDAEDLKTPLLPVAVVGSEYPEIRHKVSFGMRTQGLKIEDFISGGTMTDLFEYAEMKGIAVSIWCDGDRLVMKNMKTGELTESTVEKLLGNSKKQ